MSVTLLPVGTLRSLVQGKGRVVLEEREGHSLEDVCREIGLPLQLIGLFVVNGKPQSKDYLLRSNDEVRLISLVGGG
jgi:sulfur carrier protein ThiS